MEARPAFVYELSRIEENRSSLFGLSHYGLEHLDVDLLRLEFSFEFERNDKKGTVILDLHFKSMLIDTEEDGDNDYLDSGKTLFHFDVSFHYEIPELESHLVQVESDKFRLHPDPKVILLEEAYGIARGIIHEKTKGHELGNFPIPLFPVKTVIQLEDEESG